MNDNDYNLGSFDTNKKDENRTMLDDTMMDDYNPIQKNAQLFKYILYTTKFEIKSNSLIKMIYSTSLFEIFLWLVGFLIFLTRPSEMYLIFFLLIHVIKGILGLYMLSELPKTYEIIENVAKNPNFDEEKIIEIIQTQIRETFMDKWTQNKGKLMFYLILTIISFLVDIVIFTIDIIVFGKDEWFLSETTSLIIVVAFLVSDVIYFLWMFTLSFTFPSYMIAPIKKAILGRVMELKMMVWAKFRKPRDNSPIN